MSRPTLDRELVTGGSVPDATLLPPAGRLALPEKAVQFGTGGLLRGLVDAAVDEANAAGRFNGRIVAIASTESGRDTRINRQDGLFTLVVQGMARGEPVRECRIVASLSRAIFAGNQWSDVLACARNPLLEVVFSNTTEIGITLDESDAARGASALPTSFPGRLTLFLEERARHFGYAPHKGLVVIPCELIERNGDALREIVLALSERWQLPADFSRWVRQSVRFCNTLVDRIVAGTPPDTEYRQLSQALGYDDLLMTACEPYRLLAIEGDAALRSRLSFVSEESGVVVVPDITPYRERKVRILNGGHTVLASLALLAGRETVREAVEDEALGPFLRTALLGEILPSVTAPDGPEFVTDVLERFANPFIRHQLRDVMLHCGVKMRVRVVPSIVAYSRRFAVPPSCLALGFAAYLLVARDAHATMPGPLPADAVRDQLRGLWSGVADDGRLVAFVRSVCRDTSLWGADLDALPGFSPRVVEHLTRLMREGVTPTLAALSTSRVHAPALA